MHLRDALASKNYETPFMASLLTQLRPWGPIWGKASSPEDVLSIESRKGYGALSLPHGMDQEKEKCCLLASGPPGLPQRT